MKIFWKIVGIAATVGMFIIAVWEMWSDFPVPPRANITCEDYPVAGLQIRSNRSGKWNQSAVADNGDVVLDIEYAGKMTPASVYTMDQKTLLAEIILDFEDGRVFQRVQFEVQSARQ